MAFESIFCFMKEPTSSNRSIPGLINAVHVDVFFVRVVNPQHTHDMIFPHTQSIYACVACAHMPKVRVVYMISLFLPPHALCVPFFSLFLFLFISAHHINSSKPKTMGTMGTMRTVDPFSIVPAAP